MTGFHCDDTVNGILYDDDDDGCGWSQSRI